MKILLAIILENLRMSLLAGAFLTLLIVVFSAKSCSKKPVAIKSNPPKPAATRIVQQPRRVVPPQPKDDEDDDEKPAAKPVKSPAGEKNEKKVSAPKKNAGRPNDLAAWTADDFLSARRENDRRLIEAINRLPQRDFSRDEAASLLVELLETPASSAPTPVLVGGWGPGNRGAANTQEIIEAVAAALFANDSPSARKAIAQLAAGGIASLRESDRTLASGIVVKTLLATEDRWRQDALIDIAVHPQESESREGDALRNATLAAIRKSASASFRLRLAKQMTSADVQQSTYEELWTCLSDVEPENATPQITLYEDRRLNVAARAALESRWLAECGKIWQKVLQRSTAVKLSPVAKQLWRPVFAASLEERLADVESLDAKNQNLPAVLLAATIPDAQLRVSLFRLLKRQWENGPASLDALANFVDVGGDSSKGVYAPAATTGMGMGVDSTIHMRMAMGATLGRPAGAANVIAEPGFVLLVKRLHRKDAPMVGGLQRRAIAATARLGATSTATSAGPPKTKIEQERELRQLHELLAQDWMQFSEKAVQSQLRRFAVAAAASPIPSSEREATVANWSNVPHPPQSAKVVAVYCLNLPGDDDMATGMPRVWYWRAEQRGVPVRAVSFYSRQVPNGEQRLRSDKAWIDCVETLSPVSSEKNASAVARSVDVVITRPSKAFAGLADQEQQLIVEAMVIECDAPPRK